ncbi:MAG: hypothetical protein ABI456_10205 [Ktedonobacteraceae bacterium]
MEPQEEKTSIEKLLDEADAASATHGGKSEAERLIQLMAQRPDESLPLMLSVLEDHPDKLRQAVAIEVLRLMGYPRNEPALPLVLLVLGDINHPGLPEAIGVFVTMGLEAAVPFLLRTLEQGMTLLKQGLQGGTPSWDLIVWAESVDGISVLCDEVETAFAVQCSPVVNVLLLYLCFAPDSLKLPRSLMYSLLRIIERAGEHASYVLPTLIELLKSQREEFRKKHTQTWGIIDAFSSQTWAPYLPLFDSLG